MVTLNCKGHLLTLEKPAVMGILNITPDSFYEGARSMLPEDIMKKASRMQAEGALIIDIGGQSTRPGSEAVSAKEEMERIIEPITAIHKRFPDLLISVDTYYAEVARNAVEAGASIVNDISGGLMDANMLFTVAELRTPFICMHMRGTPQTMQGLTSYDDLVTDIMDYFIERIDACQRAGINDMIIDPGFGFSKNTTQNFQLLREMKELTLLGKPLLAGLSRKSTICKTLGIPPAEALNGTTVMNTIALLNGASILRVHDVKEAVEAITLVESLKKAESSTLK